MCPPRSAPIANTPHTSSPEKPEAVHVSVSCRLSRVHRHPSRDLWNLRQRQDSRYLQTRRGISRTYTPYGGAGSSLCAADPFAPAFRPPRWRAVVMSRSTLSIHRMARFERPAGTVQPLVRASGQFQHAPACATRTPRRLRLSIRMREDPVGSARPAARSLGTLPARTPCAFEGVVAYGHPA